MQLLKIYKKIWVTGGSQKQYEDLLNRNENMHGKNEAMNKQLQELKRRGNAASRKCEQSRLFPIEEIYYSDISIVRSKYSEGTLVKKTKKDR